MFRGGKSDSDRDDNPRMNYGKSRKWRAKTKTGGKKKFQSKKNGVSYGHENDCFCNRKANGSF